MKRYYIDLDDSLGPFVNKIFESSLEGAEQKVQQLEEADAASAEGAQPLSIIADCLMMIVAWLFYFIKIEWLDEREESSGHAAKKHRASTSTARVVARTATTTVPAKANECLRHCLALLSAQWCFARPFSPDSRVNVIRAAGLISGLYHPFPSVCLRAAAGATACTTPFRPQLVAGSCT